MKLSTLALCAALAAPGLVAGTVTYSITLDGPSEDPPVVSAGTGFGFVIFDTIAHTMYISMSFENLMGNTTVAHIHCCTAAAFLGTVGVATTTPSFTGFPAGVKSGSYQKTFDMTLKSSFNAAFVTNNGGTLASAEAALLAGAAAGKAYFNLHSSFSPRGEIRGFLAPVPEPATFAVAGLALAGLAALRRKAA